MISCGALVTGINCCYVIYRMLDLIEYISIV